MTDDWLWLRTVGTVILVVLFAVAGNWGAVALIVGVTLIWKRGD